MRTVLSLFKHVAFLSTVFIAHLQSNDAIRPYHRYGDEFNPFKMMEINKAYPDNLLVRNGIGFHFAYAFQPIKDELYLFRRIDVNHIAAGIRVLKQSAAIMKDHCKKLRPAKDSEDYEILSTRSDGTIRKKFKHNFFLAHEHNVSQEVANKICEQHGAYLPEIFHLHELVDLVEVMKANGVDLVHSGVRHDLSMGIKRFRTSGLPADDGRIQTLWADKGAKMERSSIWEFYRDYRAEWYYHNVDYYIQRINTNQDPTLSTRCAGYHCEARQVVPTLTGAPVICQRVINPPTGSGLKTIRQAAQIEVTSNGSTRAEPRKQLFDMANEYYRYCKASAVNTEVAAQTLEARLKGTLERVNIFMQDIDIPPGSVQGKELAKSWSQYLRESRSSAHDSESPSNGRLSVQMGFGQDMSQLKEEEDLYPGAEDASSRKTRVKRWSKLLLTGLSSLMGSGIARLIRYHYVGKKQREEMSDIHKMVKQQSMRLDNLELQTEQFENALSEVISRINNLEETTGTLMIYSARLAEILAYDESLHSAITNIDYAVSRLEAIAHSSQEGRTHMFALDEEQMEKAKNLIARNTAGLLKENLANMRSGFIVDPTDSNYVVLVINTPTVSREVYVATELVPIHFFHGGHKYRHRLKSQYFAMDHRARTFYEMEEKDFMECRHGRCIQKSLTKRISDHPCEFPLKADEQELFECEIETMTDLEPFFKLQHPDGVLYSVEQPVVSTLSCPNKDWIMLDVEPTEELVRHGTIQIPQGCYLEIKKQGTVELTIPGPPVFKMIDLGELDFTVTPADPDARMDVGLSHYHREVKNLGEARVDELEIRTDEIDLGVQRMGEQVHSHAYIGGGIAATVVVLIVVLFVLYRKMQSRLETLQRGLPSYFSLRHRDAPSDSDDEDGDEWPELPPEARALALSHIQPEDPKGAKPKVAPKHSLLGRQDGSDESSSQVQSSTSATIHVSDQSSAMSGQDEADAGLQKPKIEHAKKIPPPVKPRVDHATLSRSRHRRNATVSIQSGDIDDKTPVVKSQLLSTFSQESTIA